MTGDRIDHVDFYVDNEKIMTKHEPPYSLELDLGIVPASRRLRVVGLDRDENLVAGDEIFINTGVDPFRVHIAHPRIAPSVVGQTRVEVDLELPEGRTLDRIDLYLNEDKIASMYERPYAQTIYVPSSEEVGYLRAVAVTKGDDPLEAEDVVFINTPQFIQEIDVHLVELPTTVLQNGRPVQDLPREAFEIFDDGQKVEIARFEYVRDIPLNLGLAIDSSGSMSDRIVRAQRAAAQFFRDLLQSGDKAFVVSFSDVPVVAQKWTDDREALVRGLAGLRAEDATALFDSIVYSLYNFQGVKGQKALVVLSDGKDTSSKFTYEQALEYARRSAVPVYSIGIGIPTLERDTRGQLAGISRETGGRSYFINDIQDLEPIYDEIELELRAQYLLGFYPPESVKRGSDWREITVRVHDGEARTIRGYYP
ncbi:MAG: VWA domain-containing protein [Acidobacteria bacterium]|nr:VWA domain-containing protein [Acidobacteriota bacterium]